MKFRTDGVSVRLRLRRSEVRQLAIDGRVTVRLGFGPQTFEYSLELDKDVSEPVAEFSGDALRVLLPYQQGIDWCETPQVSLRCDTAAPPVLIEKDFVRSAVVEIDDYDRYENPRSGRKPPPPPA